MTETHTAPHRSSDFEALQSRFALRLTACLTEQAEAVPQDVSQRLRFAREQALERSRALRKSISVVTTNGGGAAALMGRQGFSTPWWTRFAAMLPLAALVAGLVLIQTQHEHAQIAAAAEIDADLLVDVLPPAAYSDEGFVEFLKAPRD